MLAKPERRSISWWLFITITGVMGASLLTIFSYYAYASCQASGNGANNSGNSVDCALRPWKIGARVANVVYPNSADPSCPVPHPCNQVTVNSSHYVNVTNTCPIGQNVQISWVYGSGFGDPNNCGIGGGPDALSDGSTTVDGGQNFLNTHSMSSSWTVSDPVDCVYLAQAYTRLFRAGGNVGDTTEKLWLNVKCP